MRWLYFIISHFCKEKILLSTKNVSIIKCFSLQRPNRVWIRHRKWTNEWINKMFSCLLFNQNNKICHSSLSFFFSVRLSLLLLSYAFVRITKKKYCFYHIVCKDVITSFYISKLLLVIHFVVYNFVYLVFYVDYYFLSWQTFDLNFYQSLNQFVYVRRKKTDKKKLLLERKH